MHVYTRYYNYFRTVILSWIMTDVSAGSYFGLIFFIVVLLFGAVWIQFDILMAAMRAGMALIQLTDVTNFKN
jgi:hypothetical protein